MTPRALAATLAVLVGCGDSSDISPQPDAGADQGIDAGPDAGDSVVLAPYAGWPEAVLVRQVGHGFRTSATQLEVDGAGRIWLLQKTYSDQVGSLGAPVLERFASDGLLAKTITFADGALAPGFVVHPSGELTVLVLAPDAARPPGSYRLDLTRLAPDGALLSTTEFTDVAASGEELYYDDSGVHVLPIEPPLRFNYRSHLVGLPDGEGLHLLAWSYGVKLYRLDRDYHETWDALVMPANLGMAFNFIPEVLARDEDGRVHVALQLFADDVRIYNQHFGRTPPLAAIDSYDVLVERFGPDGGFAGAAMFGGPGGDAPTGMTARRGKILVTGAVRAIKHDLPNRTREWDLFVLRGDLDDRDAGSYTTLDLQRDDFAWAMGEGADGTVFIGGRNDYVQVDTNSEVEDGKGLLLALSPDLSRRRVTSLTGPRDVAVQALRLLPDGRLLFAGTRNGPLTHTPHAEWFNEGVLGVTRLELPQARTSRARL